MQLKKTKQEILSLIENNPPWAPNSMPDFADVAPSNIKYELERYVKEIAKNAAKQAVEVLIDNLYDYQDFEKDLGLDGDQVKK